MVDAGHYVAVAAVSRDEDTERMTGIAGPDIAVTAQ